MSNNYYKDQESVANIAIGLMERGWKVYGYREDQSDSMTDYYSPARWEGIAIKNGYVLLVDVKYKNNKSDYPTFSHANPKRCNWHIEKDGEMIAKGKGAYQCDGYLFHNYKDETMSKVNAFIDRIEKFIKQAEKVGIVPTVENNQITNSNHITLEIVHNEELNGLELYFTDKPIESVRNELKSNGFYYLKTKKAWIAKKTESRLMLAESLQSVYNDIKNEIETNGSLSDIDIIESTQKDESITETAANDTQETVTAPEGKITVQSITFEWSESAEIESGLTVNTFAEAESIIKKAAVNAPDNGAYDKTKFTIKWSDGQTYTGRIDIVKSDMFKSQPLKQHIIDFANMIINGEFESAEQKQAYQHLLDTYPLEDFTEPTPTPDKPKGKVLDITSRIQAKQEQEELNRLADHWTNNILPFMSNEEIDQLLQAYKSDDNKEIERLFTKISLSTAVKRAREELKQN